MQDLPERQRTPKSLFPSVKQYWNMLKPWPHRNETELTDKKEAFLGVLYPISRIQKRRNLPSWFFHWRLIFASTAKLDSNGPRPTILMMSPVTFSVTPNQRHHEFWRLQIYTIWKDCRLWKPFHHQAWHCSEKLEKLNNVIQCLHQVKVRRLGPSIPVLGFEGWEPHEWLATTSIGQIIGSDTVLGLKAVSFLTFFHFHIKRPNRHVIVIWKILIVNKAVCGTNVVCVPVAL